MTILDRKRNSFKVINFKAYPYDQISHSEKAGFSMAGVLVGAALLAILSIAVTKIIDNAQKGQQSVRQSTEFNQLLLNVQKIIDSPSLCATAFRKDASTPATFIDDVGKFQDLGLLRAGSTSSAITIAQVGMDVGNGMKITKLQLQQLVPADTSIATKKIFHAALFIEAKKNQNGFGGAVLSNRNSPILVSLKTNLAGLVEDCSSKHVLPTCAAGQNLEATSTGSFICVSPKLPTACSAGQILQAKAGGGFACVNTPTPPTPLKPINGYWTSYWDGRHGIQHNLHYGQYICGFSLKQNCDGASSEDACFSMKICTP